MGDINDRDNIETLKKEYKKKKLISEIDNKNLREKVEMIISRNEEEARRKKIEEMERLYELGLYS